MLTSVRDKQCPPVHLKRPSRACLWADVLRWEGASSHVPARALLCRLLVLSTKSNALEEFDQPRSAEAVPMTFRQGAIEEERQLMLRKWVPIPARGAAQQVPGPLASPAEAKLQVPVYSGPPRKGIEETRKELRRAHKNHDKSQKALKLAQHLGIAPEEQPVFCRSLLANCPNLVFQDLQEVSDKYKELRRLVPVEVELVLALLVARPEVLVNPNDQLRRFLRAAAPILGVGKAALTDCPDPHLKVALAALSPEELQRKVDVIHESFSWAPCDLLQVLLEVPQLLRWSPGELSCRLQEVKSALGLGPLELSRVVLLNPRLLTTSKQVLRSIVSQVCSAWDMAPSVLTSMLLVEPGILTTPVAQQLELRKVLGTALGASLVQVHRVLEVVPELIAREPLAVRSNIVVVREAFGLSDNQLLEVFLFDPTLLAESPGPFTRTCQLFALTCQRSKTFRYQLQRLIRRPANLARALGMDKNRHDRLLYLQSTNRAIGTDMKQVLSMTHKQFIDDYPGFELWREGPQQRRKR